MGDNSSNSHDQPDNKTATTGTTPNLEMLLPIRITSTVVRGFGRGSSDLGIPTANLCRETAQMRGGESGSQQQEVEENGEARNSTIIPAAEQGASLPAVSSFDDLPCGIYWGFARFFRSHHDEEVGNGPSITYTSALSIGFNPTYGNATKTVEPHLIAAADDPRRHASSCGETDLGQDLYGMSARLSVVGYLRPELPFEGLDKLTLAIKQDIARAEKLAADCSNSDPLVAKEKEWVASSDPLK